MARAISRARSLVRFVLLNSGSPWSWLWMATRASNKKRWPRMPPGSPDSSRLKVEATSWTPALMCDGRLGDRTVPVMSPPSVSAQSSIVQLVHLADGARNAEHAASFRRCRGLSMERLTETQQMYHGYLPCWTR